MKIHQPQPAVCFFGIPRSLEYTVESIRQNILDPLNRNARPGLYAHFFDQKEIHNPRSGEYGAVPPGQTELIGHMKTEIEAPDTCLEKWNFQKLKAHGDFWDDGFASMRNLIHQLHSLNRVTELALADGAEQCLFLRPDLMYHDNIEGQLAELLSLTKPTVAYPHWQRWKGGVNDRFAWCNGRDAIVAYGQRIQITHQFCALTKSPLQGERLARFSIWASGVRSLQLQMQASRVRLGGTIVEEDFRPHRIRVAWQQRRLRLNWPLLKPNIPEAQDI